MRLPQALAWKGWCAMPMVDECAREDCPVLTMGELCLEHERELAPRLDLTLLARAIEEADDSAAA